MKRMMNISIRKQLLVAFGIIALLSATLGAVAFAINSRINASIAEIRTAALHKAEGVSVMAESLRELSGYEQELLMEEYRGKSALKSGADSATRTKINEIIAGTCRQFQEMGVVPCRQDSRRDLELSKNKGHLADAQEATEELILLDDIQRKFALYVRGLGTQVNFTALPSQSEAAQHAKDYSSLSDVVEKYEYMERHQLDAEAEEIENSVRHANFVLLGFASVILALSGFLIWYIDRLISHPIGLLKTAAQRISRGDLNSTVDLPSSNEFGLLADTFNLMTHDLQATTVSKDYVDSILKSMVNSLVVLHPNHTIKLANEATLALLGYNLVELTGQPMDMILKVPGTRPDSVLDEAQQNGSLSNVDVNYQSRDGQLIPMSFSASVLRESSGATAGLICVAQDILERKKAERELEQANKQLLETSRQAGMAEVATSVLHNVGNVLNSVNVSSAIISDKVQNSKISNLTKVTALIEANQSDLSHFFSTDPKGKQLPGYLSKLATNLAHEQKEILQEVGSLIGNIVHIKEIVAMQQNYARVSGILELLDVASLMEDAIRINIGALERHQVKVVRDYADLAPVLLEKHKVLQILVNLIRNAKHACDAAGRKDKLITLHIGDETGRLKLSVRDNGIGIPEANMERIFSHGFTTKKEGHGFGLHSSALTAREMGGGLTVFSEGVGHGSIFTLDLPIQLPATL